MAGVGKEWARNGSFMKKPAKGWLHDDTALSRGDGVYYPVKYVGSVIFSRSMRDLDFDDRTIVTREAITLACEAAGIRPERRRQVKNVVRSCLRDDPEIKMLNVKLTISTTGIALVVIETNQVIANHIMPNISFSTGGEAEDYESIGYVAKDNANRRECHVFDCGHMAADVIATIGQAFELRYKSFLAKGQGRAAPSGVTPIGPAGSQYGDAAIYDQAGEQTYDDLPGAQREELYGTDAYGTNPDFAPPQFAVKAGNAQLYESSGLRNPIIASPQGMYGEGEHPTYDTASGALGANPGYRDDGLGEVLYDTAGEAPEYDDTMTGGDDVDTEDLIPAPGAADLERPLGEELWFHPNLDRRGAESFLQHEGDFLVRESTQAFGQYILSVMQDGVPKHLLLVDPNGVVRTRDTRFDSPSHLINYHIRGRIPILSRGSSVMLGNPVPYIQDGAGAYGDHPY